MAETETRTVKKRKLPLWAAWLLGWGCVLLAAFLLVYYWRVIFFIAPSPALPALPATLGAMAVCSLLYWAVFCATRLAARRLALKAALLVFLAGLLFCFSSAPLQAPDESTHYLRMVSVSMGRFTYDGKETYPSDVNQLVRHFGRDALNHEAHYGGGQLVPARMAAYHSAMQNGEQAPAERAPIMFMLLPFLPGAMFMAVTRLFGGDALALMYAGRLANLVVYAMLCYFAFRQCRRGRGLFFAFALLPLSLFMAASCSYDSLMLAGCLYLLSFLCKDKMRTRDAVVFCAVLALCTYIKPMNFVLAALLLCIPKERWQCRFRRWQVAGALAVAALVFWYALGLLDGAVLKHGYGELPRGNGSAADPAAQLAFVLQNPLSRLGSMDLSLPAAGGLSVLSLCLATALSAARPLGLRRGAAAGVGLTALVYAGAIIVGMYVLQSDLFSLRADGLQPRYFLPAFLLVLLLAAGGFSRVLKPAAAEGMPARRAEGLCLRAAAGLAFFGAVQLFQSYFIGQWFAAADGQWRLVNLFGHIAT